uniref:Uncharacterized protein n=1 Tax=virus sp. ctd0M1 TaxID=2827993 RepID=A0A8S5RED7_9VIRU|nr:MAG TPA: hypothetical protein [virus sp. ctd0M1]
MQCQRQRQCELQQHVEHEHTRAALILFYACLSRPIRLKTMRLNERNIKPRRIGK